MTWNVTLVAVENRKGRANVVIEYTDTSDGESFKRVYKLDRVTAAIVRDLARKEVEDFEGVKQATLPVGKSIDITPETPPAPTPPTQEEIDQEKWMRQFRRFRKIALLVDLGILPSDDPRITPLRKTLRDGWKDDYLDGV